MFTQNKSQNMQNVTVVLLYLLSYTLLNLKRHKTENPAAWQIYGQTEIRRSITAKE